MVAPKMPIDTVDPALYERLRQLPENQVGELINGELFVSPRPAVPHANAASVIGGELWAPFHSGRGGPGGWRFLNEPELHLGSDVLVPEIAGWRRERLPDLPDAAAMTLAPDWVLEVLSPTTSGLDRVFKLPKYAAARVAFAWIVDPKLKTLEVYRLEGKFWSLIQTFQGSTTIRAEPFDAIELNLGELWISK